MNYMFLFMLQEKIGEKQYKVEQEFYNRIGQWVV